MERDESTSLSEARAYAASLRPGVSVTDVLGWGCAADNYEPTREHFYGWAVEYTDEWEKCCYRVTAADTRSLQAIANGGVFIVDDGVTVRPYYSAGFNLSPDPERYPFAPKVPHGLIHPFPVNGGVRADNGQPVNFDSWMLGPHKCYHLKVRRLGLEG